MCSISPSTSRRKFTGVFLEPEPFERTHETKKRLKIKLRRAEFQAALKTYLFFSKVFSFFALAKHGARQKTRCGLQDAWREAARSDSMALEEEHFAKVGEGRFRFSSKVSFVERF